MNLQPSMKHLATAKATSMMTRHAVRHFFTFAVITLAAVTFAGLAHAAPLIYEPFSQAAGSLNGQAGGTGLNNWTTSGGTVNVVNPSTLSYGDLQNAGGQTSLASGATVAAYVTTTSVLGDNNLLDDGATLWFSTMFLPTSSGGGTNEKAGFAFGTSNILGQYNGLNMQSSGYGVGFSSNAYTLEAATWSGGGNASLTGTLALPQNASTLIVGKIEWGATSGDTEQITVYTPSTTDLGTLGTGKSRTVTGFDQTLLNTISFTQRNSGGVQIYDEIRFGATLADVTPPAANDGTWNADADGNWSDTGNWVGGTVADGADKTATFGNVFSVDRTVSLDSDRTIGNITYSDTGQNLAVTPSAAEVLTLDTTSGTPTINVAGSKELTINNVIAGNDGLLKTGTGEFRPRGANTFTGGISLFQGRISIRSGTDEDKWLGDASNVVTFTGNAELYNENSQFTMPQGITINNGVTGKVTGAFGERTQVQGVLAGSGTLYVQGFSAGYDAEFLNTANTFTGPIQVHSGDSVTLGMRSLADSPGATTIGLDSQANNGAKFEYMSGAIAPLVLNNRQFELITNGSAGTNLSRQPGIMNNAATANTMTINTDLLVTGTGMKRFFLMGNNTGDNTFAGAIPDAIGADVLHLYKDSGGKWILSGNNTYEGDTFVNNGTLEIGGSGVLGGGSYAGNISIGKGDTMVFGSSADQTLSGNITDTSDDGKLVKSSSGILTLAGTNSYNGTTTVSGGTLVVNGSLGNTAVTVGSGASLKGSGGILGSVTVNSGATLAPGTSIESLATGALDLASGSTFEYEIDNDALPGVAGDLTAVTGDVNITSGAILDLVELGTGSWADEKLTLISYTGALNGLFTYNSSVLGDGDTFTFSGTDWLFDYDDALAGGNYIGDLTGTSFVTMTAQAVPEPSTIILTGLGLMGLTFRRRK